jgi:hypothetical protein
MHPNLQGITQQTIDALKTILTGPGQAINVRKDITTATGLVAYNLEPVARLLQPAFSPLRNRIPRVQNTAGGTAVNWKVIESLDTNRAGVFTAEGVKAGTVSITVVDRNGAFKTISLGDYVTFKAQWAGRTFEDVKARAVARLLKTGIIREEQGILGGRNAAFAAVTNPTVGNAAAGGSIADATYNVYVRALTHMPGSGITAKGRFSAAVSTGALAGGGDNIITATVPCGGRVPLRVVRRCGRGRELQARGDDLHQQREPHVAGGYGRRPGDGRRSRCGPRCGRAGVRRAVRAARRHEEHQQDPRDRDRGHGHAAGARRHRRRPAEHVDTYRTDRPPGRELRAVDQVTDLVLAANGAPTLYVQRNEDKSSITGGPRHPLHQQGDWQGDPHRDASMPAEGDHRDLTFEMPFSAATSQPDRDRDAPGLMRIDYAPAAPRGTSKSCSTRSWRNSRVRTPPSGTSPTTAS